MINRIEQILNIRSLLVSSDRTKQMKVRYCTHRSPRVQKVAMRQSRYNTESCSIYTGKVYMYRELKKTICEQDVDLYIVYGRSPRVQNCQTGQSIYDIRSYPRLAISVLSDRTIL